MLRQSLYSRLAGYEDLNDAARLSQDPTFRLIGSEKILDERREKRAELRAKRREEMEKAMQEQQANLEASGGPAAGEGEKKSE